MRAFPRRWLAITVMVLGAAPLLAQTSTPPAAPVAPAAPTAPAAAAVQPDAVAATVNGQPITELMVQRGLEQIDPKKRAEAREELLNFLIDNLLVEQYLVQLGITVDKAEVDKRIEDMRKEANERKDTKDHGKDFDAMLKEMKLSMEELRQHITADIRWDKHANSQATDKALRELFDANKEMFNGSMVRARHILLTPPAGDAKAGEEAQAKLEAIKKKIEDQVAAGMAKLPANSDALAKEKARTSLIDEAFASFARTESVCPSKAQGGDVNWFMRQGMMVEPFAKKAFELKLYEMGLVKTQYGYHLILVTDRKAGEDVPFEKKKEDVKEVFCERLRENVATQVRAKSKIVINPTPKP